MDPFSTVVGGLQIGGQCVHVAVALAKYIHEVATVDQRISGFYDDVLKLKSTYETLEQSRNSPQLLAAAKSADDHTGQLWTHLSITLRDCENTLVAINHILRKISKPDGAKRILQKVWEPPLKQLREQLHGGELGRHHEKIKMFNTSLALPMHMITITLQLDLRDQTEDNQRELFKQLREMQRTISTLHTKLNELRPIQPLSRTSTSNSTLINAHDNEKAICDHVETFAKRAKQFLSAASTTASTRSGTSTILLDDTLMSPIYSDAGVLSASWHQDVVNNNHNPASDNDNASTTDEREIVPPPPLGYVDEDTDKEKFDLNLVRIYFEQGQEDLERDDFEGAEENFIEALELLKESDFGDSLAFQAADVVLMLTECYTEQNKLDEAVELLLPLTMTEGENAASPDDTPGRFATSARKRVRPDQARVLAAHYSLGKVFLKKQGYEQAEQHAMQAYHGRRRFFGDTHEKTIEAVQLVVDIFTAKGQRAKARTYSKFLAQPSDPNRRLSESTRRLSAIKDIGLMNSAVPQGLPIVSFPPSPPLDSRISRKPLSPDFNRTDSHPSSPAATSVFDEPDDYSTMTRTSIGRTISTITNAQPQNLRSAFDKVKITAALSKDKGWEVARDILKQYHGGSQILQIREDELKKNVKRQGAEKGLAATGQGYAPIHFFCDLRKQHIEEVRLLIEDKVDLMAIRLKAGYKQERMTPLQLAIERSHQVISILIIDALLYQQNVSIAQILSLQDRDGLSPLLTACRMRQVDVVRRLLAAGAGVVAGFPKFWCGNSLLHEACRQCDVDMVSMLLVSSISSRDRTGVGGAGQSLDRQSIGTIDQQDKFGRTPLMYAIISSNLPDHAQREKKVKSRQECVEKLLRHIFAHVSGEFGGDGRRELDRVLAIRDSTAVDAVTYARAEKDQDLIALVERYAGGRLSKADDMAV